MRVTRRTRTAIAALSSVALVAGSVGTAQAEPAPANVGYSTTVDNGSVRTLLDAGTFALTSDGSAVSILDAAGATVASVPLSYSVDEQVLPIASAIGDGGRSLTLTPNSASLIHPVYSPAAYQNLVTQIQIGWNNGGSVSAGIGAGIGAVVGCVLFIFVGCIPGAALGATIGVVNGVTSANPAATDAAFEFIRTLP
ncbi:hypothetical protein [Rhodococcoides yunnanense]|uniref:hypothetical protein n=1 Tax=Rhodococcoides yunnanense TaxID=278209 RepID=UPI000932AC39|nr:hypothetical protein [Rhodococcus yunnanensis]